MLRFAAFLGAFFVALLLFATAASSSDILRVQKALSRQSILNEFALPT